MKHALQFLKILNIILWILFLLHILAEFILSPMLNFLFSEMYYVPLLSVISGFLCWFETQNEQNNRIRCCNYLGTVFFLIIAITTVAYMALWPCAHSREDLLCGTCGREIIAYFLPILAIAVIIQQSVKFKTSKSFYQRFIAIFSGVLTITYIGHCLVQIIDDTIDFGSISLIPFAYKLPLYLSLLLIGNCVIAFIKQVKETIAFNHKA